MLQGIQPRPAEPLWCYERDGAEFGPTNLHGLQAMADSQHLRPECDVWRQGRVERLRAAELEGMHFPSPEPLPMPFDDRYLRLYRSADNRVLFGLCGGLAHRWGVPATLIRLVMLVLVCGMVGLAYPFAIFLPALPTKGRPRVGGRAAA